MGDKDLYADNVRTYYITSHILFPETVVVCNVVMIVFLMVKLDVEKVDVELLEEERVDYDTM